MGKKGGGRHLKREVTPTFWPIYRKKFTWAIKPSPGPHPLNRCIPLGVIIRDLLGFAKTRSEAKKIVSQGKILIDGRVRRDEHFPVGLMDVLSIPEINLNYRVLPSEKGLTLHKIDEEEAKFKVCRIENKNTVNGGHIQLNLHDGRNILIRSEDPQNPSGKIYQTHDTLKISLPDQEILEHLKLNIGMTALIVDGKNIGRYGTIRLIEEQEGRKRRKYLVAIEDSKGDVFQTIMDYIFVIGDEKPRISLRSMEDVLVVS